MHPFLFQDDLPVYCREHDIALEAYSPLTRTKKMNEPVIQTIAQKYSKTPAQTMLRWRIEHGISAVPKASKSEHQNENLDIFDFDLSTRDMEILDNLSGGRILPNPALIP